MNDMILSIILLTTALLGTLAGILALYELAIRALLQNRYQTTHQSHSLRGVLVWRIVKGIGVGWTILWLMAFIVMNVWGTWPRDRYYWTFIYLLPAWLYAWLLCLLPSIPALLSASRTLAKRFWDKDDNPSVIQLRTIIIALGWFTLILIIVTPLAVT
jgi:hypothetical protein